MEAEAGAGWIASGLVSLTISVIALALSAAAYLRVASRERREDDDVREAPRAARSIREGLEESLIRVRRAQQRLGEISALASDAILHSLDALGRQLVDLRRHAEHELTIFEATGSARGPIVQEAIARRVRHVEANLEVLRARAEISTAEALASNGEFVEAEELLEDALARIREVQLRLSDVIGEHPAFAPVLDALHEAVHSLRARAADHKRQLDTVLSASDSLLAWLKSREPREPAALATG